MLDEREPDPQGFVTWDLPKQGVPTGVGAVGPRCERCNDSGWHYSDPLDPSSLEPCCEPSGKDGVDSPDGAKNG
jgi:hypothetical protein